MNAPSSFRRPAASPTDSAEHDAALVPVSLHARDGVNDDTEPIADAHRQAPHGALHPFWMITATLALFSAAMAIVVSS